MKIGLKNEKGQSAIETLFCLPILLLFSFSFILLSLLSMARQLHLFAGHELLLCHSIVEREKPCLDEYRKRSRFFFPLLKSDVKIEKGFNRQLHLKQELWGHPIPFFNHPLRLFNTMSMKPFERTANDKR